MEPNEAMKAMALKIVKAHYPEMPADYRGRRYQIALAAIMETTELAATYAEHRIGVGLTNRAADYRAGDHYALAGDRRG